MHPVGGDYLQAISTLHAEGENAFAVTLASLFGVSRAAASATVGRLARDGLVSTQGRRVLLTEAGAARAEAGIRRHNVTERFLVDVLGMGWAESHEQARIFERGLTPLLAERIDERLGHPEICPHGNYVPRSAARAVTLQDRGAFSLARAPLAAPLALLAISELAEQRLDWLALCAELGLIPGANVTVLARLGHELTVRVGGQDARLEAALAARLWVVSSEARG